MVERQEVRIVIKQATVANGQIDILADVYPVPKEQPREGQRPAANQRPGNDGDAMTEPQRRYLFRLLAAQGVEGQAAEGHLRDYFRVRALKDVTRQAASQYIDQLVRDQKENGGASA